MSTQDASTKERLAVMLRDTVEIEIRGHGRVWCSPDCTTFIPEEYRNARIAKRYTADQVQRDYDLCHIFR